MNVKLKVRGMDRAQNCAFPPLKVSFKKTDKKAQEATDFENLNGLKLVTHCDRYGDEEGSDSYLEVSKNAVQQEYLMYKMYQLLTPESFGVRIAKITYIDTLGKAKPMTRMGFFIEQDGDLVERLQLPPLPPKVPSESGSSSELVADQIPYDDVGRAQMHLFQAMLGNWDYSATDYSGDNHNTKTFLKTEHQKIVIPYDFARSHMFVKSKFDTKNLGYFEKIHETSAMKSLACLDSSQQKETLEKMTVLAKTLLKEVAASTIFTPNEKKSMSGYTSGYLTWLAKVPTFVTKASCKPTLVQ